MDWWILDTRSLMMARVSRFWVSIWDASAVSVWARVLAVVAKLLNVSSGAAFASDFARSMQAAPEVVDGVGLDVD